MRDTQQSKELGDTPVEQPNDKLGAGKDTMSNSEPQLQSITGARLTLILVALLSAMFLVALVSYVSPPLEISNHKLNQFSNRTEQSLQLPSLLFLINFMPSAISAGMPAPTS
jgi:hypothetical protein